MVKVCIWYDGQDQKGGDMVELPAIPRIGEEVFHRWLTRKVLNVRYSTECSYVSVFLD